MTYKGKEIKEPTIEMISEYISKMGFGFSANEFIVYYSKRNWLTRKGQPIKTLESAINSYNGSVYLRQSKSERLAKTRHFLEDNKGRFNEVMDNIFDTDPSLYVRLYIDLHNTTKGETKDVDNFCAMPKESAMYELEKRVINYRVALDELIDWADKKGYKKASDARIRFTEIKAEHLRNLKSYQSELDKILATLRA